MSKEEIAAQTASEKAHRYATLNNRYAENGQRAYDEEYARLYDSVYPDYLAAAFKEQKEAMYLTRWEWDGHDYNKNGRTGDEPIHYTAIFKAMKTRCSKEGGQYKYVLHTGIEQDFEYIDSFTSDRNDLLL